MRIAIDCDGVLADFNAGYHNLLVRASGKDHLPRDVWKTRDFPTVWYWEREAGWGEWEDKVWKEIIIPSTSFWRDLKAYDGVRDGLKLLNRNGHDLYFVTNRPGNRAKAQTEAWLYKHGIDVPTVLVAKDKAPIIKALEVEAFIDDKVETLKKVAKAAPDCKLFVPDWGYNRDEKVDAIATRVPDFLAFAKEISK